LLRKRIDAARADGRLNIAAMGFKEIPEEVMNMYDFTGAQDASWAEAVDVTRFVAADNELERIMDDVFPDIDPREAMEDEDGKGNQFGGLETLDLHGNILVALPLGLRRLERLTVLNLSNNKLGNDCFEVISQIQTLRDLKIAGNCLTGSLDDSITQLRNLERLDLQRNALTSLPDGLADLVHLRILNIAENRFSSLPFTTLRQLPLVELLAAKNVLGGALVAEEVDELPLLQVLDVTGNALKSVTLAKLELPVLYQLNCSSNRLTSLPDMSTWVSLLTLAAEDNNISTVPEGFVTLPKVKNVDFSGNDIKSLDDRIGGMDSLETLRITGNPLREKKFAGMTTEDLKRALKLRMDPVDSVVEGDRDVDNGAFYSAQSSPTSPNSPDWPIKAGGILDRSNTQAHSLNPVAVARVCVPIALFRSLRTTE
jgi:Leucine-rich repeat (LRR) protein